MAPKVMTLSDFPSNKFKENSYDRGVLTVNLSSWMKFDSLIKEISKSINYYIWRGQRWEDSLLKSSFDRLFDNNNRENLLHDHLQNFKKAMRGRRGQNPPELDKDNCWALGQHYRLYTPLLDWTESPFVAAYFAFFKQSKKILNEELLNEIKTELKQELFKNLQKELSKHEQTENRVVYGLSRDLVRWGYAEPGKETPDPEKMFVRFVEPESDENPRLISQRGILTYSIDGKDVKEWVKQCYSKPTENRIILFCITIPDKDREEFLRFLNKMNINDLTLFPDLIGATQYCNCMLTIDDY